MGVSSFTPSKLCFLSPYTYPRRHTYRQTDRQTDIYIYIYIYKRNEEKLPKNFSWLTCCTTDTIGTNQF